MRWITASGREPGSGSKGLAESDVGPIVEIEKKKKGGQKRPEEVAKK